MSCLFCKIVAREIPAQIAFENDRVLAFRDIHPAAPTHVLVIPKQHISGIADSTDADAPLLGEVLVAARTVAKELGLNDAGFRLVVNQGLHGGQSVHHLHVHILGGRLLAWPPG